MPLNGICRNNPPEIIKLLKGDGTAQDNKLCTTLFCISSCLKKLSRHTELPESRYCPSRRAGACMRKPSLFRNLTHIHTPLLSARVQENGLHLLSGNSVCCESFLRHEEMQNSVVHILLFGVVPSPLSRSRISGG